MLCDMCAQREAVIFIQQLSINGKKEVHLCEACAREQGVIEAAGEKISMNLSSLANGLAYEKKLCPVCARGIDEIRKTLHAGCPECYAAFKDEIRSMLGAKGVDLPYTGSMPKKLAYFRSLLTDRMAIQSKLKESLACEDYEKAAKYRDFLKTLERPAVSGTSLNRSDTGFNEATAPLAGNGDGGDE